MDNSDKKHDEAHESELLRFLKDRGDPFSTPEGYFSEQLEQIMGKLKAEDEKDSVEESPSFGERSVEVFQTPRNYFEEFPKRMMAQLSAQEGKTISFKRFLFPAAIAAAIALLIAVGWSGIQVETNSQMFSEGISDFSESEMLALLEQEDLDADLLLELVPEDALFESEEMLAFPEEEPIEDMDEFDEELDALFDELDSSDLESLLLE